MLTELNLTIGTKIHVTWKELSEEKREQVISAILKSGANIERIVVQLPHKDDITKLKKSFEKYIK
jgi:hypothetical protein